MNATPLRSPAIDAVLTMCAGVPCSRMIGRKVCTPWITPHRLTPKTHRQSSSVWSWIRLNVETPALLHSTSTRPNRSSVVAASSLDGAGVGHVDRDGFGLAPGRADPRRDRLGLVAVEVGDDDRRTRRGERLGEGAADAARRAGHHRDPPGADHIVVSPSSCRLRSSGVVLSRRRAMISSPVRYDDASLGQEQRGADDLVGRRRSGRG